MPSTCRSVRIGPSPWAAVLGVVLAASVLVACDPAPTGVLTVNSAGDAGDANPGDGVCEATTGPGICTLRAAIEEGNALGRAHVTVNPSVGVAQATSSPPWTVTGRLTVSTQPDVATGRFVVASGGSLSLRGPRRGITGRPVPAVLCVRLEVHGTLVLEQATTCAIGVAEGGLLVARNSAMFDLTNNGTAHLQHVTLLGAAPLVTGAGAQTFVSSSLLQPVRSAFPSAPACQGSPPISGGYNLADDTTCGLSATGDLQGVALTTHDTIGFPVPPTGPALDRIPVGVNGCGTAVTVDLDGKVRPVDADGVGGAACDVGPLERAAA